MWKDSFFVIVSSFLILGYSSYASSLCKHSKVSSPAPSPGSGFGLGCGGKSVDKPRDDLTVNPKGSDVRDECSTASDACRDGNKLSACLVHSGDGSKEAFIVVQNGGETSFTVKVLYTPANISAQDIVLGKQRIKKANVTMEIVGSSLTVLNAGFGECVIHLPATVLGHHIGSLPSFWNGSYRRRDLGLLQVWEIRKTRSTESHIKSLKWGKTDVISANDEETPGGWDDDWDEIREFKPSGRKVAGNPSGIQVWCCYC